MLPFIYLDSQLATQLLLAFFTLVTVLVQTLSPLRA